MIGVEAEAQIVVDSYTHTRFKENNIVVPNPPPSPRNTFPWPYMPLSEHISLHREFAYPDNNFYKNYSFDQYMHP